jgi:hypothetical protein
MRCRQAENPNSRCTGILPLAEGCVLLERSDTDYCTIFLRRRRHSKKATPFLSTAPRASNGGNAQGKYLGISLQSMQGELRAASAD